MFMDKQKLNDHSFFGLINFKLPKRASHGYYFTEYYCCIATHKFSYEKRIVPMLKTMPKFKLSLNEEVKVLKEKINSGTEICRN